MTKYVQGPAQPVYIVGSPAGVGTQDVTISGQPVAVDDDGGSLSVDDGGASLTVDGAMSLLAGEEHIGSVGGDTDLISVTPTLSVAGAYITGDYVGETGVAMEFTNAMRTNDNTGQIISAVLIDKALQSKTIELWLFSSAVVPPADNAAWTITDAHMETCLGVIVFDEYYASLVNSVANPKAVNLAIKGPVANTSIWGCAVIRASGTYATGDLIFKIGMLQD